VLTVSDGLYLEITDDGVGLPVQDHTGVGRLAMQERAAELGGTCLIETMPSKGTRVLAYLPLAKE
jgi:signal transduction histidine kinase